MAGRFFSGFAAGSYGILLPLYIGEVSSKEIRGSLLSLYQIILNFGEVFVFTFGYFANFMTLNIVCGVIPLVYTIVFMQLPESPVFLVSLNNTLHTFNGASHVTSHFFRFLELPLPSQSSPAPPPLPRCDKTCVRSSNLESK